ncbi:MAG: hypothetical protein JNL98_03545 [Bryobacterales bacterium]|nr:hypothetical protein [Bryobacterales bacterium]
MPHSSKDRKSSRGSRRTASKGSASTSSARYTVGLAPGLARQVERYATANGSSMSKAIAALVRIGLEGQEQRKRDFFKKLKANLATADTSREDELVDEFRSLILGR